MRAVEGILIFGLSLVPLLGCASTTQRPLSNHFDGTKFYNPTLSTQFSPSFVDIIRMFSEDRAEWPEQIENRGVARLHEKLGPADIGLTFINHATFLIQLPHLNILTDPVWSERVSPFSWIGPKRVRAPGVKFEDLPKIDLVVISHNHYDHLDKETLKKLNERFAPKVLVPAGDKELIEGLGIKNVRELDWWEGEQIDASTRVIFAPTQHSSARGLFDRDHSLWGSYFIEHGGRSVYFGGDAGYSSHYADIRKRLGSPDIALLGLGAYLPRWFMKPMHMDPAEAVIAHHDLGAKASVAMHFGTFQLSAEAIDQPQTELKAALAKKGVAEGTFISLSEGETRLYKAPAL